MFPITHIFCIEEVLKKDKINSNPFHYFGSIFPDIVITGILSRKETHYIGEKRFINVLPKSHGKFADFSFGLVSHGTDPKGIDFYCDENPKPREGYAFNKSESLVRDVQKATGLNDLLSIIRSHNFIELAIDILICEKKKEMIIKLDQAKKISQDSELVKEIAFFFDIEEKMLIQSIKKYFELLIIPKNINQTSEDMCKIFKLRDNIKIDSRDIKKILIRSIEILREDYEKDLMLIVDDVSKNIKHLIPIKAIKQQI